MVKLAQEQNWHAKSGLDYALALKNCLDNSTAKYIVIFEGDVLVAESWFSRVMWHLREFYERGGSDEKWLQLRIFNEERASGFTDKEIFRNNVPLICVLAGLGVAGSILALRSLSRRKGSRKLDFATNYFILVLCALTIPSFIILFFATGKATVLPPSPGLRYENFGCCTQAMIYSRAHIQGIYDALTTDYMTWDYDIRIKQYGRDNGVKGLSLYPMMVQHLGFESVINPDRGDAIWSVAFEGLRRERLREEHRRMHGSLLGEEAWVDTMEKTRGWKTNKDLPSLGG